jgi:hypothetical protein
MKMWMQVLLVGMVIVLAGCAKGRTNIASVANTVAKKRVCEIHKKEMEVKELQCALSQLVNSPLFSSAMNQKFPHPEVRLLSEYWYGDVISIKAPVCPDCSKAYWEWHQDFHKN